MFGSLGGPELILILVVALIVFGPRRLPEIGKSIGKMLVEFRRASTDFKRTIEEEVETEKLSAAMRLDAPAAGAGEARGAANATPGGAPAAPAGSTPSAAGSAATGETTGAATTGESSATGASAAVEPAAAPSGSAATTGEGAEPPPDGTVARSGAGPAAVDSR